VPWTRLLLARGEGVPDDLNLGIGERASAAFVLAGTAALPFLPFAPSRPFASAVALVSLVGFAVLQRRLLAFLIRRLGLAAGLGATALHWVYFLYSSVTFVAVHAEARVRPAVSATSDA